MPSMTIQQLRAFQAIIRNGSASEAARELNRSQPAITACIRSLETQLDLKLFTRSGNKILPTAEARYLFERSKIILKNLDETVDSLVEFRKQFRGELKVACMPAASQVLIPQLLSRFLKDKPNVKLTFFTRTSDTIENWIASQQFDIGLSESPSDAGSELFYSTNFNFQSVLAVHKSSPLATMDTVTLSSLAEQPYVGLFEDHSITQALKTQLAGAGLKLNQHIGLQTIIPAFTFIEANMGYSVVDPLSAQTYRMVNRKGPVVFRTLPFPVNYNLSILLPRFRDKSILCSVLLEELNTFLANIKDNAMDFS